MGYFAERRKAKAVADSAMRAAVAGKAWFETNLSQERLRDLFRSCGEVAHEEGNQTFLAIPGTPDQWVIGWGRPEARELTTRGGVLISNHDEGVLNVSALGILVGFYEKLLNADPGLRQPSA